MSRYLDFQKQNKRRVKESKVFCINMSDPKDQEFSSSNDVSLAHSVEPSESMIFKNLEQFTANISVSFLQVLIDNLSNDDVDSLRYRRQYQQRQIHQVFLTSVSSNQFPKVPSEKSSLAIKTRNRASSTQ